METGQHVTVPLSFNYTLDVFSGERDPLDLAFPFSATWSIG